MRLPHRHSWRRRACDDFGDCGSQKITIIHHLDADDIEASKANIVFEFAP